MKYQVIYDIESGMVNDIREIRSAEIESDDQALYDAFVAGECRARVVEGRVVRDDVPVSVSENVVPDDDMAEKMGLAPNVGIPRAEYDVLRARYLSL